MFLTNQWEQYYADSGTLGADRKEGAMNANLWLWKDGVPYKKNGGTIVHPNLTLIKQRRPERITAENLDQWKQRWTRWSAPIDTDPPSRPLH